MELYQARPAQVSGAVPDPLRLVELYQARPAQVSGAVPDQLRSVGLHHTRSGQWSCTRPAQVSGGCTRPALHQTRSGQWELHQTRSGQWGLHQTSAAPDPLRSVELHHTRLADRRDIAAIFRDFVSDAVRRKNASPRRTTIHRPHAPLWEIRLANFVSKANVAGGCLVLSRAERFRFCYCASR